MVNKPVQNSDRYASSNSLRDTRSQSVKMEGSNSNQNSDPADNINRGDSTSKRVSDESKRVSDDSKNNEGNNSLSEEREEEEKKPRADSIHSSKLKQRYNHVWMVLTIDFTLLISCASIILLISLNHRNQQVSQKGQLPEGGYPYTKRVA